jgi:tRNA-specific 2-thiouridylase
MKIAVALSGGIDSAFAAHVLKSEGFDVFGVIMKTSPDEFFQFNMESVKKIADRIDISFHILDLTEVFESKIIEPFCRGYLEGVTPNPCVECNRIIKFGFLLDRVKELGADCIATGHYVRSVKNPESGLLELRKGLDEKKDQSYFLWRLNQQQLKHIIFPLGRHLKREVQEKAKTLFPEMLKEKESQEICFIGDKGYKEFFYKKFKENGLIKSGVILNTKGEIIGKHKGYVFYTIGQRRGLGISYKKPLFIKKIIPEKNILIAGEENEIMGKQFNIRDINFISGKAPSEKFNSAIKIRYNSPEFPGKITILNFKKATVTADRPQKAITPGQSAVFYDESRVIGGGIIG